jgi:hypothetical protein
MGTKIFKRSYHTVLRAFSFKKIKILILQTSLTNIPIIINIKKQTRLFISTYSIKCNRFIVSVAMILQSNSMDYGQLVMKCPSSLEKFSKSPSARFYTGSRTLITNRPECRAITYRPGRSQTGMKIEIVNMFT